MSNIKQNKTVNISYTGKLETEGTLTKLDGRKKPAYLPNIPPHSDLDLLLTVCKNDRNRPIKLGGCW